MDIKTLVGLNFPLNQLVSSGVGQAKPLTDVLFELQSDVRAGRQSNVKKDLNRLQRIIDDDACVYGKLNPLVWISDMLSTAATASFLVSEYSVSVSRGLKELVLRLAGSHDEEVALCEKAESSRLARFTGLANLVSCLTLAGCWLAVRLFVGEAQHFGK